MHRSRPLVRSLLVLTLLVGLGAAAALAASQFRDPDEALAEPFVGITTDGTVVPGLYEIRATGVSTAPVVEAAEAFLASLTPEQREATTFPVDSSEWRDWHNIHRYDREGIRRRDMTPGQEEAALGLLRASLSADGFAKSRDIMRLNGHLADLLDEHDEYGEGLYHFTVMGEPSETDPWGWQLDGHHLVINYFVLGDQVVMTPTFMGSEPVHAESGPYAGTRVFEPEQDKGLALAQSLSAEQRESAILADSPPRQISTPAFHDNFRIEYAGIRAAELDESQRGLLLELIREYVGNMDDGHAEVKMAEVREHLADTRFAWMGGTGDDAVFYYRVHSPVILIEFDHQGGVALEADGVTRDHVHTVVRTPNGNDYGKDLLRQHHERYAHVNGRHRARGSE
ncbi:MAG: DUF3500 domain-containing protein [Acidobacteriota bacterium]